MRVFDGAGQVLPALERRFDGRAITTEQRLALCAGARPSEEKTGPGSAEEDGLFARVLGVLNDAGPEGVYLADVPVLHPLCFSLSLFCGCTARALSLLT